MTWTPVQPPGFDTCANSREHVVIAITGKLTVRIFCFPVIQANFYTQRQDVVVYSRPLGGSQRSVHERLEPPALRVLADHRGAPRSACQSRHDSHAAYPSSRRRKRLQRFHGHWHRYRLDRDMHHVRPGGGLFELLDGEPVFPSAEWEL
jgi:hypothetical protein